MQEWSCCHGLRGAPVPPPTGGPGAGVVYKTRAWRPYQTTGFPEEGRVGVGLRDGAPPLGAPGLAEGTWALPSWGEDSLSLGHPTLSPSPAKDNHKEGEAQARAQVSGTLGAHGKLQADSSLSGSVRSAPVRFSEGPFTPQLHSWGAQWKYGLTKNHVPEHPKPPSLY